MMRRMLLVGLGLAAMTFVVALHAQPPGQKKTSPGTSVKKDDLAGDQRILLDRFKKFEESLSDLRDRLAKSDKKEDQKRAETLGKALEKINEGGITANFAELIKILQTPLETIGDLNKAHKKSLELAVELKLILEMIRADAGATDKRAERLKLEELIKEIEGAIRASGS